MALRVAIITTGEPQEILKQCFGGFDQWFMRNTRHTQFQSFNVYKGDLPPKVGEFDKYIITGSPAMVTDRLPWSESLKPWIRQLVEQEIPLLAVCYGHQLLADAMGGIVDWHPNGREIGTVSVQITKTGAEDSLLGYLPQEISAHVSHAQSVIQLPKEACLLAKNNFEAHHAFRIGKSAWGLQFHPEFDEDIMRGYLIVSASKLANQDKSARDLLNEVRCSGPVKQIVNRFIEDI